MPFGKAWIYLFSLQLWVNTKRDWVFSLGNTTNQEKENTEIKLGLHFLKNDVVFYHEIIE